jgi:hypothetical protein
LLIHVSFVLASGIISDVSRFSAHRVFFFKLYYGLNSAC